METAACLLTIALCSSVTVANDMRPMLRIPDLDAAPVIDGKADEPVWQRAAGAASFTDITSRLASRTGTAFLMGYTRQALYVFVRCEGEPPEKLVGEAAARDSVIWGGSLVEVFLEPEPGSGRYFHFMVNHAGAIADEYAHDGVTDLTVNPDWTAITGRQGEAWTAEMSIPFESLGLACPAPGTTWRANVCRNAAAANELVSWAPVSGGFHQPEQFGEIAFAGDGPVAAVDNWFTRAVGRHSIRLRATAGATAHISFGEPGQEIECPTEPSFASIAATVRCGAELAVVRIVAADGQELLRAGTRVDITDPWVTIRAVRSELQRERELGHLRPQQIRQLLDAVDHIARGLRDGHADLAELEQAEAEAAAVATQLRDLRRLRQYREARGVMEQDYYLAVASTMTKVQPDADDPGQVGAEARVSLARGEAEGVQLVVCPITADLSGVRVSISPLVRDDGVTLPPQRVEVNPVGFVPCQIQTPGAALSGRVPDVLLPNRAMDIPARQRQPYFVTVRAQHGDSAGTYRGTVHVQPANAQPDSLPIIVRVYDVDLPLHSPLRTAFVLWGSYQSFMSDPSPEAVEATYIEYAKTMLAHRLSPITFWSYPRRDDGTYDFARLDAYLAATVPLGLTTLNVGTGEAFTPPHNVEYGQAVMAHLRERGWQELAYFYGHDEASPDLLSKLQEDYRPLAEADPDVKVMQTGWDPHPDLEGLVRIWCPLTAGADAQAILQAQRAGDEVWWYVCCGPTAPYANFFVDYPGIDHRILGWMTFQHGIQGFLYWGVDVWPGNTDSAQEYDRTNYAAWNPNSYGAFNGDGYLLYPGVGDRAVPSFRLAAIRDGFEDYDLFHVLRELSAKATEAQRAEALELLRFDDLIPSLTEYTHNPDDLLQRRETVLQLAEKLAEE